MPFSTLGKYRDKLRRRNIILLLALGAAIYFIVTKTGVSLIESSFTKSGELEELNTLKKKDYNEKINESNEIIHLNHNSLPNPRGRSVKIEALINDSPDDASDYHPQVLGGVEIKYPAINSDPLSSHHNGGSYPVYKSLLDVLHEWNPDQADPPSEFTETLMHFDYGNMTERQWALNYRNEELPFKVYNVPEFDQVSKKWTTDYLKSKLLGSRTTAEKSKNNHFMFWHGGRSSNKVEGFKPPTERIKLSYSDWLEKAKEADRQKLDNSSIHYYFMYGTSKESKGSTFLDRDMASFSSNKENFFVFKPELNKGIQCRFGMRGIIAESHYDGGRNMVAMIRGTKRYILNPPESCKYLGIIDDIKHPSFRHSVLDWSDMKQAEAHKFAKVNAIDTIVREGEVLYIPSYWFHYIISLEYSIQCNSRSGSPTRVDKGVGAINECLHLDQQKSRRKSRKKKRND